MLTNINALLLKQVEKRGGNVALRFKKDGSWWQQTWAELAHSVRIHARTLHDKGVGPGQFIPLPRVPGPETLSQFLAIQWLGASTVIDASRDVYFALETEGSTEAWDQDFLCLKADHVIVDVQNLEHGTEAYRLAEWTAHAEQLIRRDQLHEHDDAFGGPYWELILPWLVSGFRFHLPEHPETLERDRSEFAPTFMLETAGTYASWYQSLHGRLPQYGLGEGPKGWLARRRLRRILGLHRLRVALVQGGTLSQDILDFYESLGVTLEHRPYLSVWAQADDAWPRMPWLKGLFEVQDEAALDQYKVIL
jgi:hypothetical protein